MEDAQQIIGLSAQYISTYLAGPILIFTSLAAADLLFEYVLNIVKSAKKEYRY